MTTATGAGREIGIDEFLRWLEAAPDPTRRFQLATEAMRELQQAITRLRDIRARSVRESYEHARSYDAVARQLGMSRQRAAQLAALGGGAAGEAADPASGRRGA